MDHHNYPEEGDVILIDKPLNWTSFQVVKKIKNVLYRKYGIKKMKVGHAGTLDPLATGLVIICTRKQTKRIQFFQDKEKEYIAEIRFGITTPSFDLETESDQEFPFEHISKENVIKVLKGFLGEQQQIPPVYSAKNLNGKRAYEYARKGTQVEMKPNPVIYHSIEHLKFNLPEVTVKVVCSKGTYIRSFARDLGEALNSGAHLTALRRIRIGDYYVDNALKVEEFENKYDI